MDDAEIIIREAFDHGASRVSLLRAAAAAIRAVALPENSDVLSAIESVERWLVDPNDNNARDVKNAEVEILKLLNQECDGRTGLRPNEWLIAAVAMLCFGCGFEMFEGADDHPAVCAVEYVCKAASGLTVDLGPIVTAELL